MNLYRLLSYFLSTIILAIVVWFVIQFNPLGVFTVFTPLILAIGCIKHIKWRNAVITILVICWGLLFHYESSRHFYLNPFLKNIGVKSFSLPKTKFLFPPAGWIMFYNVGSQYGTSEVYGVKDGQSQLIDPHDIFRTRTIGYDNIHRGILNSAARSGVEKRFCSFLWRRFPYFDRFLITVNYYPSMIEEPYHKQQQVKYQCNNK